jgi:hypothetical protein
LQRDNIPAPVLFDVAALTRGIITLAGEYGRYDYRRNGLLIMQHDRRRVL